MLRAAVVVVCLAWLLPGVAAQGPFDSAQGRSEPGSVGGRVTLTKRIRGVPLPSSVYQPRAINRRDGERTPEINNVVVYLKDAAFSGPLPTTRTEIRQVNESFSPRVSVITRGSTIDFPNTDPIFHNVFSLSGAATFDLGRFPQGTSRSRVFNKPGLVKVYCHLHSQMSATILVLDHPYFTVPELDGSFSLADVPSGRHTLAAWHERVGERTAVVHVENGRIAMADLSLPVEDGR
jgi:plastocyanin